MNEKEALTRWIAGDDLSRDEIESLFGRLMDGELSDVYKTALLVALALGSYLVGVGTSLVALQGLSVVIALAGGVLYLRGPEWLRALRFPIAFTIFMVPIPEPWIAPLIARLQLIVSTGAVEVLQQAGFSIYRDGNVMVLPGGASLFVAEACSGITSIITLLPLAVFLGYFTQCEFTRRALLVAAVIPIAMLGNGLRVIGTVVAARYWGADNVTQGSVHEMAGVAVYVVGCLALVALSAALPRAASAPEQPAV